MEFTEGVVGKAKVVAPKGRLDSATAPALDAKLTALLRGGDRIVADFANVHYVSSAGLRVLLKATRCAREAGGAFAIAAPQKMVLEVLELGGFDRILPIRPTVEEAAAALD